VFLEQICGLNVGMFKLLSALTFQEQTPIQQPKQQKKGAQGFLNKRGEAHNFRHEELIYLLIKGKTY
jgi:hypothetical protein